jgi:cytochrome c5
MNRDICRTMLQSAMVLAGLILCACGCQTTGAPMGEGERLYRAKCSSCHQPVDPGAHSADRWRARLQRHGPKLTDAERAALLMYLTRQ